MQNTSHDFDAIIVGAGPVGTVIALQLAKQGRRVAVVEARASRVNTDSTTQDPRILALSRLSVDLLQQAGVTLPVKQLTAIQQVHVSQAGAFGRTLLSGADIGVTDLGYTMAYHDLDQAVGHALNQAPIHLFQGWRGEKIGNLAAYASLTIRHPEQGQQLLTSKLLIAAEGGSVLQQLPSLHHHVHDYEQSALLCRLALAEGYQHQHIAYERFAEGGPFALLPVGSEMMLVWTRRHAAAEALLNSTPAEFLDALHQICGHKLRFAACVSPPQAIPLRLKLANKLHAGRVMLVGNAAQTLHPVAAQGLNLGLRDADTLLPLLAHARDIGAPALLHCYQRQRQRDRLTITAFTHSLIGLFDHHDPISRLGRGIALSALDMLTPLRQRFTHKLVFGLEY